MTPTTSTITCLNAVGRSDPHTVSLLNLNIENSKHQVHFKQQQ